MTVPAAAAEVPVRPDTESGTSPDRTSLRTVAWVTLNALLAVVIVAVGIAVAGSALGWWRAETVLSGSMRPGINPGDVEILTSEPTGSLRAGQIVAFHPPGWKATVTHRVVALSRTPEGTFMVTKGDANDARDPWGQVRILGPRVWVVRAVVPKIGYVTVWARTPLVRLLLALGVVTGFCLLATRRIWQHP
jgi:signal peptidase I